MCGKQNFRLQEESTKGVETDDPEASVDESLDEDDDDDDEEDDEDDDDDDDDTGSPHLGHLQDFPRPRAWRGRRTPKTETSLFHA